jgi:hypothetical protein
MPKLSTFILHFSSRSPRATRTHVLIPEGTALPAVGVWRREKSGREITYTLDTSRSIDGYLAWATSARISRVVPAGGVEPVELVLGSDCDFFVGYVRPDTGMSLYYKRSDRMVTVQVAGPGMLRHLYDGDGEEDFAAE